jgi:hypothetical protein
MSTYPDKKLRSLDTEEINPRLDAIRKAVQTLPKTLQAIEVTVDSVIIQFAALLRIQQDHILSRLVEKFMEVLHERNRSVEDLDRMLQWAADIRNTLKMAIAAEVVNNDEKELKRTRFILAVTGLLVVIYFVMPGGTFLNFLVLAPDAPFEQYRVYFQGVIATLITDYWGIAAMLTVPIGSVTAKLYHRWANTHLERYKDEQQIGLFESEARNFRRVVNYGNIALIIFLIWCGASFGCQLFERRGNLLDAPSGPTVVNAEKIIKQLFIPGAQVAFEITMFMLLFDAFLAIRPRLDEMRTLRIKKQRQDQLNELEVDFLPRLEGLRDEWERLQESTRNKVRDRFREARNLFNSNSEDAQ